MKQMNIGKSSGFSTVHSKFLRNDGDRSPSRFSTSMAFFCGIFMLLAAGTAKAQIATDGFEGVVVSGTNANSGGATGDPGLGIASSNWSSNGTAYTTFGGTAPTAATALSLQNSTPASQTWTWTIPVGCNMATINQISFDYRATGTSYTTVSIAVNGVSVYGNPSLNANSAFHNISTTFSAVNATTPIQVTFTFSGGTHGAGGTFRLDNVKLFGSVAAGSSTCTGTPTAGTLSAGASTFCGSGSTTLSLTGATEGCGISHHLQVSTTSATSGFTNVGATGVSYTTPVLTTTTYYRDSTYCANSMLSAITPAITINITTPPAVAPITGLSAAPLVVGSSLPLSDATSGGFWGSSNNSIVTVDNAGVITGVSGGTATISYLVLGTGGCDSTARINVNIVWPNTLALYAGTNGTSTSVLNIPGESVSALTAVGFGSVSPCTTGGLSGLTVPVTVASYNSANPHVGYVITPNAGNAINIFRIHAITRESGTGPRKARLAYRINGGSWTSEGADVTQSVGSSCGAASNSWDFAPSLTENGVVTSFEVAVFPFAPDASTGTFQLNSLEVYGNVTDTVACSGLANPGAVLPASTNICDSGSRWLNYDGAASGVGISYRWQKSTVSATSGFSDISPAVTTASYNTGVLHAGIDAPVTYYRVRISCSTGAPDNFSVADTVNVNAIPTPSFTFSPQYLHIGTAETLASTPTGGWWSSNDTSSTSVDSASGIATGHIPGISIITYHVTNGGCTGVARDTIRAIHDCTSAAYLGTGGNSVIVDNTGDISVTNLTKSAGFGSTTACGNGGVSGMTTTATSYSSANPHVSFILTDVTAVTLTAINATVRKSNSGPANYRIAYRQIAPVAGSWIDNGSDLDVLSDDCGYSATEESFGVSLSLNTADQYEFAVFPYNLGSVAAGAFQVNTMSIINDCFGSAALKPVPNAVGNVNITDGVQLYPNPTSNVLNIAAGEKVNVSVMSIDGKLLMEQKDAKQINVSSLANGLYIIKVYNQSNALIQTAKFTKQ